MRYSYTKSGNGFTLVETLVVITIIGILALASLESFSVARKWALLDIVFNNLESAIAGQRQKARIGRTPNSSGIFCYGLSFDKKRKDQQISIVKVPYIAVAGQKADFCYTDAKEYQSDQLPGSEGGFFVKDIVLGNRSDISQLLLLFKPPFGFSMLGIDSFLSSLVVPAAGQDQLKIVLGIGNIVGQREVILKL